MITAKNVNINLSAMKAEIAKKYGSVYAYCKKNKVCQSEVSRMLKNGAGINQLQKHAKILGGKVVVRLEFSDKVK